KHSITVDDDQFKMEGFGEEEAEFTLGENLEIPDTFPKDIPIPDDANVYQANAVQGGGTVSYHTEIHADEIDELYSKYFESDIFIETPSVNELKSDGEIYKTYEGMRKDGLIGIRIATTEAGTNVGIVYEGVSEEQD